MILRILFSPTRAFIDWIKGDDRAVRGNRLRMWSLALFIFELLVALILFTVTGLGKSIHIGFVILLIIYAYSRCNEVAYAFYRDTFRILSRKKRMSDLRIDERVKMAIRSYFALIVNFAIFYYFIPLEGLFNQQLSNFFNAIYFSVVTITTLGYGEIHPTYWLSQFLIIYQVLIGLLILLVAIANYISGLETRNA